MNPSGRRTRSWKSRRCCRFVGSDVCVQLERFQVTHDRLRHLLLRQPWKTNIEQLTLLPVSLTVECLRDACLRSCVMYGAI